ncbi:MAG: YicC family protein [candidate division Zixibacteria bacterium]|nr:YicC family protein [candidate division Zixibacteria bacterium]
MISSMTGYGKAEATIRQKKVTIEVTSVNNRYLEVSLRLPKLLSEYENEVREAIGKLVSRGKLSMTIVIDDNSITPQMLKLNEDVAHLYHKMFRDLKTKFKLSGDITVSNFVGLPELFTVTTAAAITRADVNKLIAGVRKAIGNLNQMRQNEGNALAKDMAHRVRLIETALAEVERFQPRTLERYRQRLTQLIEDILPEGQKLGDAEERKLRLDMEIALMADKSDVTEECVRLRSHCEAFIATIKAPGDTGKRLNFILQEMNREANTIGSKSIVYEASEKVIRIREEIEKLREQVQNIE